MSNNMKIKWNVKKDKILLLGVNQKFFPVDFQLVR